MAAQNKNNCACNQSITTKLIKHFIGCEILRFHLSAQKISADEWNAVPEFYALIDNLCKPQMSARMYNYTHLRAKIRDETRWSPVYFMLKRYIALCNHTSKLDDANLDSVLSSSFYERQIFALTKNSEHLDNVLLQLQLHHAESILYYNFTQFLGHDLWSIYGLSTVDLLSQSWLWSRTTERWF